MAGTKLDVHINSVDFGGLQRHASITILGRRRSGKSTFARWLVRTHLSRQYQRVVVMAGNRHCCEHWHEVVPPLFCMSKNVTKLQEIRDYQIRKIAENGKDIPVKYDVCLVMDDCGADKQFMTSHIMKDIQANGRHYGICIVVLAQYLMQIPCENRDQIDYLAVLHTSNAKNSKKIYEEFVNVGDLRSFRYTMAAITADHGVCWIDNTCTPTQLSECVFRHADAASTSPRTGYSEHRSSLWDFSNYHIRSPCSVHRGSDDFEDAGADGAGVFVDDKVLASFNDRHGVVNVRIRKIKQE